MWPESSILREDFEKICSADFIPWRQLKAKTILITGATGLIGSTLVSALLYADRQKNLGLTLLALVRNMEKAKEIFSHQLQECTALKLVEGDIQDRLSITEKVDYIVHGASPTSSTFFVHYPAQTLQSILEGTLRVLDFTQTQRIQGALFLSTMEVYGYPPKGRKVTEEAIGAFHPLSARNCYPIGKLACENLFCTYAQQYGIPTKVLRLTQTFGPGVGLEDRRVFAEFARCALKKKSIILKTKGETERSYLYTADAVTAILAVLLNGASGQIYTAANEETYCSIYEMAKLVGDMARIDVLINEQDTLQLGYADTLYMNLDVGKLKQLGWRAEVGLSEMYRRMIFEMKRGWEVQQLCE